MNVVYKLVPADVWSDALSTGRIEPADIDLQDGYIHLSTAEQVLETARLHFAGAADLVALEIDLSKVTGQIRYEVAPKRGAAFPHLYGDLDVAAVRRAISLRPIDGGYAFPAGDR